MGDVMPIDENEFMELMKGDINIIDIREHYIYQRDHIKGASNIPLRILRTIPENYLSKEKTYYLICETGANSKILSEILNSKGYNTYSVNKGYLIF